MRTDWVRRLSASTLQFGSVSRQLWLFGLKFSPQALESTGLELPYHCFALQFFHLDLWCPFQGTWPEPSDHWLYFLAAMSSLCAVSFRSQSTISSSKSQSHAFLELEMAEHWPLIVCRHQRMGFTCHHSCKHFTIQKLLLSPLELSPLAIQFLMNSICFLWLHLIPLLKQRYGPLDDFECQAPESYWLNSAAWIWMWTLLSGTSKKPAHQPISFDCSHVPLIFQTTDHQLSLRDPSDLLCFFGHSARRNLVLY